MTKYLLILTTLLCLSLTSCDDNPKQGFCSDAYQKGYEAGQDDKQASMCDACDDNAANDYQEQVCEAICD